MNRRAFITGLAAVLTVPLVAEAQQTSRVYRVGVMAIAPAPHLVAAWQQGLREHGWIEGQNIVVEARYSQGRYELYSSFAAEFVRLKVDVIVAVTDIAVQAAREATSTIPIVMAAGTDPIAAGFVASLARPGGQITGMPMFADELAGKQLELLKELLPRIARVSVMTERTGVGPRSWSAVLTAAARLGLTVDRLAIGSPDDFDAALTTIVKQQPDALLVVPNNTAYAFLPRLVEFAAGKRLPTMYPFREAVEAGGLVAYTTLLPELFRRVAGYVDKILKGAKPADIPVEQPTKFELVINLKTAKALGLPLSQSLLLRADQVIE
jgi:putative ABC transport system substrate-binding protein